MPETTTTPAEPDLLWHTPGTRINIDPPRQRDPQADAWITEMERLRDECIDLIRARFALVIHSLDTGESEGEVAAVLFVADEERIGLPDALTNLLVWTDPDKMANYAQPEFNYRRAHQIDMAFRAADAGGIKDIEGALA